MDIGAAIKALRKTRNLTQKALAARLGMSANAINQIEKNGTTPHKTTLDAICKELNYPISYLLFFSIEDTDVPLEKRTMFQYMNKAIKELLTA
jgi:transcriptional regulator with XRE-family HTH domain